MILTALFFNLCGDKLSHAIGVHAFAVAACNELAALYDPVVGGQFLRKIAVLCHQQNGHVAPIRQHEVALVKSSS